MALYTMPSPFFHDDLLLPTFLFSLKQPSRDESKCTALKASRKAPILQPSYSFAKNGNETSIEIELPGVEKHDISIQLNGRTLEMIAKRFRLHNTEEKKIQEVEIAHTRQEDANEKRIESEKNGSQSTAGERILTYRLLIRLGTEYNTTAISSDLKSGLLSVHIPEAEELKPVSISIGSRA